MDGQTERLYYKMFIYYYFFVVVAATTTLCIMFILKQKKKVFKQERHTQCTTDGQTDEQMGGWMVGWNDNLINISVSVYDAMRCD